jgi:hypothetical protein
MKLKRQRARASGWLGLLTLLIFGASAAQPAGARTTWDGMQPHSFPDNLQSARTQCELAAAMFDDDALTDKVCDDVIAMLERGQCSELMVPDETVYHLMNYRRKGIHGIGIDHVKKHGHDTAATRCEVDTSSGTVTVDYYRGSAKHCNNVGVILPGYEDLVWTCPLDDSRMVLDDSTYVPSLYQDQSCCCNFGDGLYLPSAYFEGTPVQTNSSLNCGWEPISN